MSNRIETFFDLPPDEEDEPQREFTIADRAELLATANEVFTEMSMVEKIEIALPTVTDLTQHNSEMDEIATKAMKSYVDLMSLGGNVTDMHAGKIYEVANAMLKTALDAKNAKADKKLRMIELQLKKARMDQIINPEATGTGRSGGAEFDRNELMRHIIESGKNANDGDK